MRGQEGGGEKRGGLEEERTRRGRERRVAALKSEEESREVAVGSVSLKTKQEMKKSKRGRHMYRSNLLLPRKKIVYITMPIYR